MHARPWSLVLGLLAACAPGQSYAPPTTTAAVIRPVTKVAAQPTRAAPTTRVERPPPATTAPQAAAGVVAAELALPMLGVLPPIPETATLSRVLPPVDTGSELPGTLRVITTLRGPSAIAPPVSAAVGPVTQAQPRFPLWWFFPFLPFGSSKAGGP